MKEVLIFGGTTEGRRLSEYLAEAGIAHTICVATEYGEQVLKEHSLVKVHQGRMQEQEIRTFIKEKDYAAVVDATHPYAEVITQNIKAALEGLPIPYYRLQRKMAENQTYEKLYYFDSHEECALALEAVNGNILLTTGSKELIVYTSKEILRSRLYIRVLPSMESIRLCEEKGISGKQILALQGPFSAELNEAIFRQYNITCIVTKESGINGGFSEKIQAAKNLDIPVFVKNAINPDLELWVGALERVNGAGIKRIAAIHRGFSSYDKKIYRNLPMWQIPIELSRRIPNLPLICDPSHIGGRRDLIASLCQQAMDLGMDGLMVESHCDPDKAWSDAAQQLTPDILDYVIDTLVIRDMKKESESLTTLRKQIDSTDNELLELLAKRMKISREIGIYKKEHNMQVLQTGRYDEIMQKRIIMGERLGMSADFIRKYLEAVHEESVRVQMEVIK
mgnify:CR=1 FL=1